MTEKYGVEVPSKIAIPTTDIKGETRRYFDVKLFNKTHPLHNSPQ